MLIQNKPKESGLTELTGKYLTVCPISHSISSNEGLTWIDSEISQIISRIILLTEYQKCLNNLKRILKPEYILNVGIIILNICIVPPINLPKHWFIRNLGIPSVRILSNKTGRVQFPIFKLPLQLSIKKIAQLLFLNYFLSLYSDLAEMHNILNIEEGNILSWQSWNFFKAKDITVIPAMPLNSMFVTVRNHNYARLITNSKNKGKLSFHILCSYSIFKILLSTYNYQLNINISVFWEVITVWINPAQGYNVI